MVPNHGAKMVPTSNKLNKAIASMAGHADMVVLSCPRIEDVAAARRQARQAPAKMKS